MNMVRINILLKDRPKCSVGCDRSVKSIALDHHDVHALTLLSSIVAGIGSEADRNESHARNFARVEVLCQLTPVDPGSAEQFERGLSASADRHVGSFD